MLKTYSREELKQLEGKRVRATTRQTKKSIVAYAGILRIGNADTLEVGDVTIYRHLIPDYQFELLENEFEVGELVEVKDNGATWNKAIYLLTVPWTTNLPYVTVRKSDNEKYRNGEDFAWIPYSQIRKIQPETNPKNIATEEQEKMFYENIVKPYFNIEEKMWFEILEILKKK